MKRLSLIMTIGILFLFFICSCTKNEEGKKPEPHMEDYNVQIQGQMNNGEVSINPVFTWQNQNSDTHYQVTLTTGSNVVIDMEVSEPYFQHEECLTQNTEYDLKIQGKTSNYHNEIHFKTMSQYENNIHEITLGNPYDSNMVIQRDVDNVVAGFGPKNQTMILSIENHKYYGISNNNGYFEIVMPAHEKSFTPTTIVVSNGLNISTSITNILFGDVYLFAGQSNMQWTTLSSDWTQDDIDNLVDSNVRFFCQDVVTSTTKLESVTNGRWFKPNESNCFSFSAIATMTGSILGKELKEEVPIGIVTAYQGDTNIANWMGPEYYTGTCSTKFLHYNAMIYPLRHTKLTGVVWYQGCNNSAAGNDYKEFLKELFVNYRELFNSPELSYYVIGLACYDGDSGNNFDFSYVRESQAMACSEDDHAYFISTCDNGDPTYIHPKAKHYICERVAKSIMSSIYNYNYYAEGPSYKSHTVNGKTVTIELYNNGGLHSEGEIECLYLAGADGKYHKATATIENGKIIAYSKKVDNPVYIKCGFGKSPFVNIFNKDNFTITPFRTDNYNTNIDLFDYDSTSVYVNHPEGAPMNLKLQNGNLLITKTDSVGYGSIRIYKWGSVAYYPEGFRLTINGTNSGAAISIRFIEGDSYEIWAYKIIDDFTGPKSFTIGISDFSVVLNKQNNVFDTQKIGYVELMVEKAGTVSFELQEARFISMERSEPFPFSISGVSEGDEDVKILLSRSLFAENYEVVVNDAEDNELYRAEQESTSFSFSKANLELGKPYYVSAYAKNELGTTKSLSSGFVFYLKDPNRVIVCNFDFREQFALDAFTASSMRVHSGLTCELSDSGVKINSSGQGWQYFIFEVETGAHKGMNKLEFKADFSNYNGTVVMQLADTSYNYYTYNLDISETNNGTFVIEFSRFKNGSVPFTTQNLMWVMFNFQDTTGNGYILLDDVNLVK